MSRSSAVVLITSAALGAAACAPTTAAFAPWSATTVHLAPVVARAVLAYEGDAKTLADAGGIVVGKLAVDGKGLATSDDVRARALDESARRGGTHLVIASEGTTTTWMQLTPDAAVTRYQGGTATTTFRPGLQLPSTTVQGRFIVIQVPPGRWRDLPLELQPAAPLGPPPVPAPPPPWYCQPDPTGSGEARCERSPVACAALPAARAGATTAAPGLPAPPPGPAALCVGSPEAACVASQAPGEPRVLRRCYPTMASCQAHQEGLVGAASVILRRCALVK